MTHPYIGRISILDYNGHILLDINGLGYRKKNGSVYTPYS